MPKTKVLLLMGLIAVAVAPRIARAQGDTPSAAVLGFFKAASDSNIKSMGLFHGTSKGPVSTSKDAQPGWDMRLVVMQTVMSGTSVKVVGEVGSKDANHRTLTTQLTLGKCSVTFPVVTVKSPVGWLVNEFDLNQAAAVRRVC